MSRSFERRLERAERQALPQPVPDMTGWTRMERLMWEVDRYGLHEMVRQSSADGAPVPTEELDARDAEDAAILAERAANAAADALARHPADARAQQTARETRDAADEATRAAQQARRVADEAARQPVARDNEE